MSKHLLHLCDDLSLPLDVITMRLAVYGDSGAGKTTFARLLAEQVHAARHRFCAIDLKNDWYGLKSSADGQSEGLPVVIFGGPRADVRLVDDAAAAGDLAKTLASIEQSAIVDLDGMSRARQEKFLAPFLDALYEANRRPLLLFCDEADRYAPQKPMSQEALMSLSSSEDIARRGRKRGIGSFWLTQRTAVLNKNVSEFANLTVIFRTPGERDLKELEDRVGRIANKETVKQVMRMAPGLADGEAIFLSAHPKLRKHMPDPVRPIQLPMPWTFDSSATPSVGQRRREPKVLAATDLKAIEEKMAAQVERARADDPKALRAELTRTKAELAKLKAAPPPAAAPAKTKTVERFVLKDGQLKRAESLVDRLKEIYEKAGQLQGDTWKAMDHVNVALARTRQPGPAAPVPPPVVHRPAPPVVHRESTAPQRSRQPAAPAESQNGDDVPTVPTKMHRTFLTALAQHPRGLTKGQLLIHAGYASSGPVSTAFSDMKRAHWTHQAGPLVVITQEGLTALGPFEPLPTGKALREKLLNDPGRGPMERAFLKAIFDVYPEAVAKGEILRQTGYASSGPVSTTFAKLVRLGWAKPDRAGLKASDEFFVE
jgi:hypothetical protein